MAKRIQPVNMWVNGEIKVAEYLQVIGTNDNYETSATNQWSLYTLGTDENGVDKPSEQIAQGNQTINGQDYIDWGNQPADNVNDWIYNWTADKLNLVIIP